MAMTHPCFSASSFYISCFPKNATLSWPIQVSQQRVYDFNKIQACAIPRDIIEHSGNGFAGFPQKDYSHKESGTSTSKTKSPPPRPRRIILVRHGQSEGNVDEGVYTRVSDPKIGLTEKGVVDAEKCGRRIREMIEEDQVHNWKVYFYVSPYKRAVDTLKGLGKSFERSRIVGMREEPRLREQDFGNFQDREKMRVEKAIRMRYGRFFYRFPNGESAADVYDRITGFRETLKSDIDVGRFQPPGQRNPNINLVIVSHGLTLRVFLMRWYKWTVEQFERLNNFSNGSMVVMERGYGGRDIRKPYTNYKRKLNSKDIMKISASIDSPACDEISRRRRRRLRRRAAEDE
ncbi:phosphoglycerate mutase-like protein AT74H isoform X4 [Rosa chinensis]|uniref:phosphoglycerate mutase-like protein AT74H isoform X4 n=1 Tax=Rosa chinensis TaxID=74649 RepID=UPI001AD92650|nr:phosphoglycerate mutase-like protein AT74H isoform X4 [Rosa chinensis]